MDRKEIAQLAQLAKLSFTPEELDAFANEFSKVLQFVDQVSSLDTEGIDVNPTAEVPVSREDEIKPSLAKYRVLELAPETDGDGFIIPRIV